MNIEDTFLINLLLKKSRLNVSYFSKKNIENLIKISSKHLIIPSIYAELNHKKLYNKIPKRLFEYFKFIFEENLKRNKKIYNQICEINSYLKKENIFPVFLKGSALIILDIHLNKGARMIGDIDILVPEHQYEKAYEIMKENGYISKKKRFFEEKAIHKPRLISKDSLFALEIHSEVLTKNKNFLIPENIIKNATKVNGLLVPCSKDLILHNIYSFEINDYGNIFSENSYKNYYDNSMILKKNSELILNEKNKYFNDYFTKLKCLGVDFKNVTYEHKKFTALRFKFKRKYKLFRLTDNFFNWLFLKITQKPNQIREFLKNEKYRIYVRKKIFKF